MRDPLEHSTIAPRKAITMTLAVVAAAVLFAFVRPAWAATAAVILAFFVMILLHELGHFVMAKRADMKVTEFFVGFGPRLWSFRRGETEYGLKALPLGGYCKIIGLTNVEDVDPADEARTYRAKGYWSKMSVILAGSAMHFLIAIALMVLLLVGVGDRMRSELDPTVSQIAAESPAALAGLQDGDRIESIDGTVVHSWDEFVGAVRTHDIGDTVTVVLTRDGEVVEQPMTLAQHPDAPKGTPYLGVSPTVSTPSVGIGEALVLAPVRTAEFGKETIAGFGRIFSWSGISDYFSTLTTSNRSDTADDPAGGTDAQEPADNGDGNRLVSVVGFGRLANQAVHSGWYTVIGLLVMINVSVGIINLVPLLPFDGGHAAIATYEAIASRVRRRRVRVDVAKLMPITVAVIAVLGFIFLSSLFLDVAKPITNPF